MLSPSKHDSNRKAELKRKSKNPDDFGVTTNRTLPKDHATGKGLVKASNDVEEEVVEEEKEVIESTEESESVVEEEVAEDEVKEVKKETKPKK